MFNRASTAVAGRGITVLTTVFAAIGGAGCQEKSPPPPPPPSPSLVAVADVTVNGRPIAEVALAAGELVAVTGRLATADGVDAALGHVTFRVTRPYDGRTLQLTSTGADLDSNGTFHAVTKNPLRARDAGFVTLDLRVGLTDRRVEVVPLGTLELTAAPPD